MRGFMARAGNLVAQNRMTQAEHDLLFYQALTTTIRQAIKPGLVREKGKALTYYSPATFEQVAEAVRQHLSVDGVDYFSDPDDDSESDSDDGDRVQTDICILFESDG